MPQQADRNDTKKLKGMCAVPKCHKTKLRCQCPNPWIEFLSKNAKLGHLSIKEHAAAYHAAVNAGQFNPKDGLNNGPCKSDPVKLCAWMVRRKNNGKDMHTTIVDSQRRRARRIITDEMKHAEATEDLPTKPYVDVLVGRFMKKLTGPHGDHNSESVIPFFVKNLKLSARNTNITKVIGVGAKGIVFSGKLNNKDVAVKVFRVEHSDQYDHEVSMHQKMSAQFPDRVPKLLEHFKGKIGTHTMGVIVMERITAVLQDVIKTHQDDPAFLRQIAHQLKDLVNDLKAADVEHGDMHFSNLGFKQGKHPKIFMIDFSDSSNSAINEMDAFTVWNASVIPLQVKGLNRALHAVGFPESFYIKLLGIPSGKLNHGDYERVNVLQQKHKKFSRTPEYQKYFDEMLLKHSKGKKQN
jgi:predicted Ser/Thr protein kinase